MIIQPFDILALPGLWPSSMTLFFPSATPSVMALAVSAPLLLMSKGWPGTTPMLASFATIGASAAAGGLFFISRASLLKKVGASMAATASIGGAFMSTPGSVGTSAGGVYGLPHSL